MKKNIYIMLAALLSVWILSSGPVHGQDARQRQVPTIVQDALALLPAATEADLAEPVRDLAVSAPESVGILAGMLVSEDRSLNSKVEYALNGVVNYVGTEDGAEYIGKVCDGLAAAIEKCSDVTGRSFLLSRLALVAGEEQIPVFVKYAKMPEYASVAIGALTGIEGSDAAVMELFEDGGVSHPLLAYAAARMRLEAAEPYLLAWIGELDGNAEEDSDATSASDTPDLASYSRALALCGTEASMKTLEKISVDDYMVLLGRLAVTDPEKAVAGAKKYIKSGDTNVRCAALSVMVTAKGADVEKLLLSALKDSDREYRMTALDYAATYAENAAMCAKIAKMFPKLDGGAQTDVLNWAGAYEVEGLRDIVLQCAASGSGDQALAAIAAVGRLGGEDAAMTLVSRLGDEEVYAQAAYRALLSLDGDIEQQMGEALEGNADSKIYAMKIVAARRMAGLSPEIFALLGSEDNAVRKAAYTALPGVVTSSDAAAVADLLSGADAQYIGMLQKALCAAVSHLQPSEMYSLVIRLSEGADDITRYYPVVAFTGTAEAVSMLDREYSAHPDAAFNALLAVDNIAASDVLFRIAGEDAARKDAAVSRFIDLVSASGENDLDRTGRLDAALSLDPSAAVVNKALNVLAGIPVRPAFELSAGYLDDSRTEYAAASAVKTIAVKTEDEIDYYALKSALEKARDVYAARNGADDGYAVDEINMILSGLQPPAAKFVLPEDEARAGYEVLFDGTDMSKWTGNLKNYSLINGTIYVTANYGSGGNLYTEKEYSDFILRFEFCFERPGVNNGVGIRTPKDVDAAYWGMCECQILDHDDPIYKDLNIYQVHGSAYGIIPAKRIVHKPVGTWNYEEIKVVGDRITVTLNGEVILDGNLREACKGHNVAPDGSDYNPYTVDHRNHPGMFNKKGYISFCGHGPGIRFRNIRVLDLSK